MADTIRVLHLIAAEGNWEPFMGIAALTAALREHGIASVIAAPDHSRQWEAAEAAGVETLDYSLELSINPLRWKDLSEMVKQAGASIVHAHDPESATLLSRSRMLFGGGTKVAVSRYDLRTQPSSNEYGSGVDAVVCVSNCLAERYRALGAPEEKIHVVPAGVNVAPADRALEDRENLRNYYSETFCLGKTKPRLIVNIAPFDEFGGQAELIEAMPALLTARPSAHLFLMGEGPKREAAEKLAADANLSDDVTFLDPDKAFPRLLAAADVYVAPARDDVSGFMLEAAMITGCAIVASDSGCHAEILADCGVLVDDAGITPPILALLNDKRRCEQLAAMARARAAQEYSARTQAGKLAAVYKALASE